MKPRRILVRALQVATGLGVALLFASGCASFGADQIRVGVAGPQHRSRKGSVS